RWPRDWSSDVCSSDLIETLEALLSGKIRLLVTTARAAAERTGVPGALESMRLVLAAGGGKRETRNVSLTDVVRQLQDMGYARVPTVTEVAQFSVRGGILDVYGFGMAAPARIEWWGDEIVSLRAFDLDTQRSGEAIEGVTVLPVRTEGGGAGGVGSQHAAPPQGTERRQSLLDLLPGDALLVLERESTLEQEVDRAWSEAAHHLEVARRLGEEPPAGRDLPRATLLAGAAGDVRASGAERPGRRGAFPGGAPRRDRPRPEAAAPPRGGR